jgi:hypothetical protein
MIVRLDQPTADVGPPRSVRDCKPSEFEPWMMQFAAPAWVAPDCTETVSNRNAPTNHAELVEVDPEPSATW